MKKVLLLLSIIVLSSCVYKKSTNIGDTSSNRIIEKETTYINGCKFSILEVDGKEYLTQERGGIIELTK